MARCTRSGTQFSAFELDTFNIGRQIDVFQARVSFAPYLEEAFRLDEAHTRAQDSRGTDDDGDEGEWEDEDPVRSRPATPLSRSLSPLSDVPPTPPRVVPPLPDSRSSSPLSDAPPSPPATPLPNDATKVASSSQHKLCRDAPPSLPATPVPPPNDATRDASRSRYKERRAALKKERRSRQRVKTALEARFGPAPKARHSQAHREEPPHRTAFKAAEFASSANGGWTGSRPPKKARLSRQQQRRLEQLLAQGDKLVEWDGINPKLILDADGRIIAVLLGCPECSDWTDVIDEMVRQFDAVRRRGVRRGLFTVQKRLHRRGDFYTVRAGVTRGPGQKRPGNLKQPKGLRALVQRLVTNRAIGRIVGFQSGGLARYLPKLYNYYCTTLSGVYDDQSELEQLFANSVFPMSSFNLGPQVVATDHMDQLNAPFGMCGLTSGGNYNHKRGGHIYLKQLKAVVEFPSGSSILIPSAAVEHGNTPIQKGETRYSLTQYAAGALFRWAAYGYQDAKSLLASEGGAAKKRALDGEPGARAAWAMGLLSKADELDADRAAVFGSR